ncbi:hypothetical protein ACQB6R_02755 [Propionibacteriaceae bacterium G1746]|uniref:hypothetical protein n=1 Tax=Aestuariimicrobium sp. G57 TaxID=3418485 RepID=UPI003C1311AD
MNVAAVARQASLAMQLPPPKPVIGPDPARNQWNMIPVGFPIWIWTTHPTTLTHTTTQQGITITMTATAGPTIVSFGDGTAITCTTTTPRPPVLDPPTPSPTCGHTYQTKGNYQISATTTWSITWQALGETGTVTIPRTAATPLRVGELVAVIVPDR